MHLSVIIQSEVPELDMPQKMEIIYEQSSATKQVSEQLKHGEQEIKEGISRRCTSESLSPLPGEKNMGKPAEIWDLAQIWHPRVPLSAFLHLNEAQALLYERIMIMIILCTSKASPLTETERLTNETSQTRAS